MALTLEAEQRMTRANLVSFHDQHGDMWREAAQEAYTFLRGNFPDGSRIRRDDLAKGLVPVLEVHETLKDKLNEKKLRQKFWITYFADLIIDRVWGDLDRGEGDDEIDGNAG